MNSIIDNQLEMQANYFVVDEKFIAKRTAEQVEYMKEVIVSGRNKDRKVELLTSAQIILFNLLTSYYGMLCGAVMFSMVIKQLYSSLSRPIPSFYSGGVASDSLAMIREQGREMFKSNLGVRVNRNIADTGFIFVHKSIV